MDSLAVTVSNLLAVTFSRSPVGTNVLVSATEALGSEARNYHIHLGKCGRNPTHWDPFMAKSAPVYGCRPDAKFACELGDLAGKFGKVSSDVVDAEYLDPTLNFDYLVSLKANLSLVVHYPNSTQQLSCADLA